MTRHDLHEWIEHHLPAGRIRLRRDEGSFPVICCDYKNEDAKAFLDLCEQLHSDRQLQLNILDDMVGDDFRSHIQITYSWRSSQHNHRVMLQCCFDSTLPVIPSLSHIWSSAIWFERELFDLLGIDFPGHPQLKRILLPENWTGHPLRRHYVFPQNVDGFTHHREPLWKN